MKSYEKAHAWRELFTMAKDQQLEADAISAMVERVTGESASGCFNIGLTSQTIYRAGAKRSRRLRYIWTMPTTSTALSTLWFEGPSSQRPSDW